MRKKVARRRVQAITVEVCGVVQIYNLSDATKLGTGSAANPSKRAIAMRAPAVFCCRSRGSATLQLIHCPDNPAYRQF
jgi:hypothetical protein